MIWLSSFPNSGSTLLRNILLDIYGVESSTFYENAGTPNNYTDFAFVKTHMRPFELLPDHSEIKAVYLLRDGRDALVAIAQKRTDISNGTTDFKDNFKEILIAAEGSYFGGWSLHTEEWVNRADVLIRFEDFIKDPLEQVERLKQIDQLSQKEGINVSADEVLKLANLNYKQTGHESELVESQADVLKRNSKLQQQAFGWHEVLDKELQNLFWSYNRTMMDRLGYAKDGGIRKLLPDFDYQIMQLLGQEVPASIQKFSVLIEANKLLMHQNDGVKRYLLELLKALYPVAANANGRWQIDVFVKGRVYPLSEYGKSLFDVNKNENNYNKFTRVLKLVKGIFKVFIPRKHKETFSKYFKKVVMKMGLRFGKTIAGYHYVINRITSGKEVAQQHFEMQRSSVQMGKYDLVHVPLPQHFEPFAGSQNKYLVTVHDLTHHLFNEFHTSSNVQLADKGLNFFVEAEADFLCISETTKVDLKAHCQVTEEACHVVFEAADHQKFRPNLNDNRGLYVRSMYGIPEAPFLFTLSTLEPRKNLLNTIRAFDQLLDENPNLKINLVIGGKNGWKSKDLLQLRHQKNIIFTGFVDENDLPILYNEAQALCYVSFYEGFGLPPLEAMSCKTPVIYGDNSSMKEFFEGYGLPATADDVSSIKDQMKKVLTDEALRASLQEKSLERSFDFSWRQTAIDTLAVYENVINKNNSQ